MAVRITCPKVNRKISWAQKMLSPGLSPIVSVAWCVCDTQCNFRLALLWAEADNVWTRVMVLGWWTESPWALQGVCFQRGFSADCLESGSGCYNHVAENITEPAISNAWHFVVNLIYLHISCATVQTNQWAEYRNHFLRPSSNWYQRGQNWK